MGHAFYILMLTQFLSSLADNAAMIVSVEILRAVSAPQWATPLLKFFFVIPYVALASWIGPLSDRVYKNKIIIVTGSVKMGGCLLLILVLIYAHQNWILILLTYSTIGIGAACYSPAKYGMIAELVPEEQLVKANAWVEILTVSSIILGSILGGFLIVPSLKTHVFISLIKGMGLPRAISYPLLAMAVLLLTYLVSIVVSFRLPRTHNPFYRCSKKKIKYRENLQILWKDPLGRLSLSVTTLFWGVGSVLQFLILVWAEKSLHFSITQATYLQATFAVGISMGSVLSSQFIGMKDIPKTTPIGILIGLSSCILPFIHSLVPAVFYLLALGALVGFFIIPMNALLQARGALLTGSGQSIAIQNMCENGGILLMLSLYSLLLHVSASVYLIVFFLSLFISSIMLALNLSQRKNA